MYPWHALAGQQFVVCGGLSLLGVPSYVITLADGTKVALPRWMTEASAAHRAELHDVGLVSLTALVELRSLVDEVREAWTRSAASPSESPASGDLS